MSDFGPSIADQVRAACQQGSGEIAEAVGRTLGQTLQVQVGASTTLDLAGVPDGCDGPGLLVVLTVGPAAALAVIPESAGLLPDWYQSPDPTGVSKLTTLAQELGMLVLPEAFMPDDFQAGRVQNVRTAFKRAGVSHGACVVSLTLQSEVKSGPMYVVWPAALPAQALSAPAEAEPAPRQATSHTAAVHATTSTVPNTTSEVTPARAAPGNVPAHPQARMARPGRFVDLPPYSRSLLRIKVPVVVTLASKRQPIERIMELGPGSILQFEKSCEEPLDVQVGGYSVASGEAVKVGEKFGVRVASMRLPAERFLSVRNDGDRSSTAP